MRIIIPMAGRGSRLRPHTLTIPKPLIPVAGKPIVQRLVEDIVKICEKNVEEIAYVIGDFGKEVEDDLIKVAEDLGAKGKIYYQEKPLGTAHAILCAAPSLEGNCVVAFADTLFKADFTLNELDEGIVWVNKIDNPSAFGVVKLDEGNIITDFVEKPTTFVSDLAIIGIYYFRDGAYLKQELQYLLDNEIQEKGEYQLTNALENMKNKGTRFTIGTVDEWLDCGNKDATVFTNQRILSHIGNKIASSAKVENAEIIAPCFVGNNVILQNTKIGPYVSVGDNSRLSNSVISNSIIQTNTKIENAILTNSMIGNNVEFHGKEIAQEVSIGDYSQIK